MIANQTTRNHTDITAHYYFLTGDLADYTGIAATCQNYLVEQGVFEEKMSDSQAEPDNIPINLEILMSEQRSLMVGSETVMMTTMEQADAMLTALYDTGITDLTAIINGYSPDGAGLSAPSGASFSRKVGKAGEWGAFIEKWQEKQVDVGFYTNFALGNDGVSGFNKRGDVAQNINEKLLESYGYSAYYYLAPLYVKDKFAKEAAAFQKTGAPLLAVDTVGYKLYSNWNETTIQGLSDMPVMEALEMVLPGVLSTILSSLLDSFVMILWFCGVQILIFLSALQKIDRPVFEAACIDGASKWEQFWKITLPNLRPIVIINIVYTIVFISTFALNEVIMLIQEYSFAANQGLGYASALSFIYFAVLLVLLGLFVKIYGLRSEADKRLEKREKKRLKKVRRKMS